MPLRCNPLIRWTDLFDDLLSRICDNGWIDYSGNDFRHCHDFFFSCLVGGN